MITVSATSTCSHDVWNIGMELVRARFHGGTIFHKVRVDYNSTGAADVGCMGLSRYPRNRCGPTHVDATEKQVSRCAALKHRESSFDAKYDDDEEGEAHHVADLMTPRRHLPVCSIDRRFGSQEQSNKRSSLMASARNAVE
jgi:hypothetical protein